MEPESSEQHDANVPEEQEDLSHPERDQFRALDFSVDNVYLEIDNAQALRTILNLLLQNSKESDHDRTIQNFVAYFQNYLERKADDLDLCFALALTFQEYIPKVYNKKTLEGLLNITKVLLTSEEGLIKEEGLQIAAILLECMDPIDVERHFIEFIYEIYANEWWRCTGIDLIAIAYSKVSESEKYKFRKLYHDLINDDSTLAKVAMAKNYFKLIPYFDQDILIKDSVDMVRLMAEDIQGTVRLNAVRTAIAIATLLDEDLVDKHMCQIFETLVTDQNWKVRQEVAILIVDIQKAVRPKLARMLLINILRTLSNDLEVTVRKHLAQNIINVLIQFKETSDIDLDNLFDIINDLNKDSSEEVKNTLMGVIMDSTSVLTPNECKRYILPLIKNTLMCQRIGGIQKIEEQCVDNINKLITVLGYPALQDDIEKFMFDLLSSDSKWRTRRKLVMTLNILALHSEKDYFSKICLAFYKKMINDPCHAIRRIVPMILPVLIGKFGFEWGRTDILNWIFNFHDHPAYFQRLIVLYSIQELVSPSILQLKPEKSKTRSILNPEQDRTYLYKVYSMNKLLLFKLDQFELNNDNIHSEEQEINCIRSDLEFYGEDLVDEFKQFDIPTIDVLELLKFVIKYILPILPNYLNDKVINVVNRSMQTIQTIINFQRKLTSEFEQEQFTEIVDSFTKENRQSIESDILIELSEIDGHMEKKVEHAIRGKEFETTVKFEDCVDDMDSLVENLNFSLAKLSYENTEALKDVHDRDDCLDGNKNFMDIDMNQNMEISEITDGEKSKQNNYHGNLEMCTNDTNDNEVSKNLLEDVDMKLFDDKKTVLEFYSDSCSNDAIDI